MTLIAIGKRRKAATRKSTEISSFLPADWYCDAMKLCQGQVWKHGGEYIRIVRLERLEVEYKSMTSLAGKTGTKIVTSKKDFCRLLKGAHQLQPAKTPETPAP